MITWIKRLIYGEPPPAPIPPIESVRHSAEWIALEEHYARRAAALQRHYERMSAAQLPADPCRGNYTAINECGVCVKCRTEELILSTPYKRPIYDHAPFGGVPVYDSHADPSARRLPSVPPAH